METFDETLSLFNGPKIGTTPDLSSPKPSERKVEEQRPPVARYELVWRNLIIMVPAESFGAAPTWQK
jgi:hypothetical protein